MGRLQPDHNAARPDAVQRQLLFGHGHDHNTAARRKPKLPEAEAVSPDALTPESSPGVKARGAAPPRRRVSFGGHTVVRRKKERELRRAREKQARGSVTGSTTTCSLQKAHPPATLSSWVTVDDISRLADPEATGPLSSQPVSILAARPASLEDVPMRAEGPASNAARIKQGMRRGTAYGLAPVHTHASADASRSLDVMATAMTAALEVLHEHRPHPKAAAHRRDREMREAARNRNTIRQVSMV